MNPVNSRNVEALLIFLQSVTSIQIQNEVRSVSRKRNQCTFCHTGFAIQ